MDKNYKPVPPVYNNFLDPLNSGNPSMETNDSSSPIEGSKKQKSSNDKFPMHIQSLTEGGKCIFKCIICDKTFSSRTQKYYHRFCNNELDKPHQCKECSKTFSSLYHLKYHKETHKPDEKIKCTKCSKTFPRQRLLLKHIKNHQKEDSFSCEFCNMKYKDKKAFDAHIKRHNKIDLYKCEICCKKFSLKSNLTQHKKIHSDKTSFRCDECGQNFKHKSSYKQHLLSHSERETLSCETCLKKFFSRKNLIRHSQIHKEYYAFRCLICNTISKRKDNLFRHIRNMHPEEKVENTYTMETISDSESSTSLTTIDKDLSINFEKAKTKDEVSQKIIINSSVIRSIGNVQPVYVPLEERNTNAYGENCYKNESKLITEESVRKTQTANSQNHEAKKKYDPCEVYRKILFAASDDEDDAEALIKNMTNGEESHIFNSDNNDGESAESTSLTLMESPAPINFSEIHWRKRTSQYFTGLLR